MASITINDPDAVKTVEQYAKQYEIPNTEAGARLIGIAKSRINALRKYAAKGDAPAPKAKAKGKAKAKK